MKKIGFIGYGHMGSVLLNSLLATRTVEPSQLIVSTRTRSKLDALQTQYPAIEIVDDNQTVAKHSDLVFLCVGTYQVKSVLMEIQTSSNADMHLVIISGGLEIGSVEELIRGPVTKIMPTLLAEVQEGVTLVCHNHLVDANAKDRLHRLLSSFGVVKVIEENQFEIGADFTSCAPGLLAALCDQYIRAGIKHGDFTYEEAQAMLLESLYGTAKLLRETGEGFQALIGRVATHGGATEGGVDVLKESMPDVFEQVFHATMQRHENRKQVTRKQFQGEA
ncbi:MAG: NAD(P)-binding domain-containing protein [Anaerolineales bacterium]|nr:NAD(P)-binding domain-containing protein [Anaerolineales bacterium]